MTNFELIKKIISYCKIDIHELKLMEKVKLLSIINTYFPNIKGVKRHLINDTDGYLIIHENYIEKGRIENYDKYTKEYIALHYKDFYIITSLLSETITLPEVYNALINKNNETR